MHTVDAVGVAGEFGEGPIWDSERSVLWWVDVFAGDVHCFDPSDGSDRSWHTGRVVSSLTPRSDGTLLVSTPAGFGSLDLESGDVELIVPLETDVPTNRLNDGKVDRAGRFWAGTMDWNGLDGKGCLYRLDSDLHCTQMLAGVTISNGIGWSPDDRLMYYVDTRTQRIDIFDFDPTYGVILNRRILVEIPRRYGTPDGLTVDSQGYVWVAMFGGGAVHRYSPDGELSDQVEVPVSNVTSCTFGGTGMNELYITSTSQELEDAQRREQPLAGSVFRFQSDVVGIAPTPFHG